MVSIQSMIAAEFPSAEICKRIAPDEAVAVGSAIEADILHSRQVSFDEKHLKRAINLPTLSKNIYIQVRESSFRDVTEAFNMSSSRFSDRGSDPIVTPNSESRKK